MMNETFLQDPGFARTEEHAAMVVLFPPSDLSVRSIPYSAAYPLALAAGDPAAGTASAQ